MAFIPPQKTLNVNQIKDHVTGIYLWTEKKDGHYLQLHGGKAYTKTGRNLGTYPYSKNLDPAQNFEVEGYGKTLAHAKSTLGKKVIPWHTLQYHLHNRIDTLQDFQTINTSLWELQNGVLEHAPILLVGTIQEAIAYAEVRIFPNGGEGLVGRLKSRVGYMSGCRNKTLVKIKSKEYLEAQVVSQTPGTEQVNLVTAEGMQFSAKAMNRKITIGAWVVVECMKINPNGIPREPTIMP
jgi:hypothetical protein